MNGGEAIVTEQRSPFGPEPSDPPATAERRRAERYPCALQPSWQPLGARTGDSPTATVRNISATGISMALHCWVKPGTVLLIKLQGADLRLSRPLPVRVMHATAQPDGTCLVGGTFVRALSE